MALLLQTHYPLSLRSPRCPYLFPNPYYHSFLIIPTNPLPRFNAAITFSGHRTPSRPSSAPPAASAFDRHARPATPLLKAFARAAVSALLFLCFGVRMCLASSPPAPALPTVQEEQTVQDDHDGKKQDDKETVVDKELEEAFNAWKSKTFALTVPLKVVALRGSIPPSWIKVYLRRNREGEMDPKGDIWAAPYRWGCMVIAYKTNKFQKHKLAPVEDWADLWRPDLAGRISMVDSPREVIGAVLKYMGASYNTNDINMEVNGGRDAVKHNLALLAKQVRLFDSSNYLKAFGVGDVWVAVGWSSDIIPAAKRMSNVAVVVPKSGASLWADLWAIPAASRIQTNRIGGRIRGPSPLIHQWIEFCLQSARALPFKQEVIPGASPSHLQGHSANVPVELTKGGPRLNGNLVDGAPPPDILEKCEFLEPLSNSTLSDYHWLLTSIQEPGHGLIHKMYQNIISVAKFSGWFNSKLT